MALNWGDVALNFTAGAIDKNEQIRKENLEQRFKELQDNKELYRALATTRYSKDLDKYYKESEKFSALKSVYSEIEKGNLTKDSAVNKIIQADPQYSKAWAFASSLGGDEGEAEQARIRAAVESNFRDKEDGSGYEFSHADIKFNLPKQEDYFQDANYWGELAREIETNTQTPSVAWLFEGVFNSSYENRSVSKEFKKFINNPDVNYKSKSKETKMVFIGDGDLIRNDFVKADNQIKPVLLSFESADYGTPNFTPRYGNALFF